MSASLGALLIAVACRPSPPATLNSLAEGYVRVALQLAQHQPDLVEAWTGSEEWQPGPRVPVRELHDRVQQLLAEADATRRRSLDRTEHVRLDYLRGQLRALAVASRRLLGEPIRIGDEFQQAMGVSIFADAPATTRALNALASELPGEEDLPARYHAFRRGFVVPAARLTAVFTAAVAICREATIVRLPLPADEQVTIESDPPQGWAAVATYTGDHRSRLRIAHSGQIDVARLLHTACHESYPGHHLQYVLIDDALVRGRRWLEFQLTPAFGPHLLVTEGAAEAATHLALDESARAAAYRDRLLPLAGLPADGAARLARVETLARPLDRLVPGIVRNYLDGRHSMQITLDALRDQALLPAPAQYLAFAERRRTAALVYPLGERVISEWLLRSRTDEERWRRLQDVFTRHPFALEPSASESRY